MAAARGPTLVATMLRTPIRALLAAVMGSAVVLGAGPVASADTNPEGTLAVDVLEKGVRVTPAGAVLVPVRARCAPHLDAFEWSVGVYQGTRYGGTSSLGGAWPVCDGEWHRITVKVVGENGRYRVGYARVVVYLGAYNTERDVDTDADDDVRAWLRPPSYG